MIHGYGDRRKKHMIANRGMEGTLRKADRGRRHFVSKWKRWGKEWRMNTLVRTRRTQISPEPWTTCLADERRVDGQLGKKRDGCFAMVLELLCKGRAGDLGTGGWEKFRLTSWKCLKRRTPTSVGTRALSVSHSKFSFPTSVSTVPLLYSPVPLPPPTPLSLYLSRFFSRPPLSSVSRTSLGSRARIELWCRCS